VRVAKVTLVKSESENQRQLVNVPVAASKHGAPPVFTQATKEVSITRKVYDVAFRCANCGNTWTETKTKVLRG
jgi:hypothetical protein